MPDPSEMDDLIKGLSEYRKDIKVEEILHEALDDPLPTEKRLKQIETALETFKELGLFGGDDERDIRLLLSLGRAYERLSHLEKAHETYERGLELAERHGDDPSRAEILSRLGRVLSRWQRWEEALDFLERSERVFAELNDREGRAGVALKRGVVHSRRGHYGRAQEAYESALALAQEAGNRKSVASASNNLAILATIRGDLEDAVRRYEACIEAYREVGDDRGLAGAYHNLGMTHADRKDHTAAMDCYERGFEVARKEDHLVVMANIHLSMAELMLEMGNSMMVPFCCARALDIYKRTGNHLGEADTYRLLGNTFALRRDWGTAEQLFRDSLSLNEEYGNPLGAAETRRDLGKMLSDQGGRNSEARTALRQALENFRRLGAQADVRAVEELISDLERNAS